MKVGLLVIASEVLEGKITDLNTRQLADFLRERSVEFYRAETVRDAEEDIQRGLVSILSGCDLVLTSGGLGPTKDDLTKEMLAQYFGSKIVYSPEAEKIASENYQRFNRPFLGKDHVYSYLPDGFKALSNSTGMAPGLFVEKNGKALFAGAGVPREFKSLLHDHVAPWLESKNRTNFYSENVVVRTKRVPEEKIFNEVDPHLWDKLSAFGDVSSLPIILGVDIGVKIKANSQKELESKRQSVLSIFDQSPVKSHVWHIGMDKLESLIVKIANKNGMSFSFAESCTGGLCSHRITNIPGSSSSFKGSVVCYDPEVKKGSLHVKEETLSRYNVVSTQVAEEMAQGVAKALNTRIAISITGLAGPTGGTTEIPVGTVCIGVLTPQGLSSYQYKLFGDREQLKERFAQAALLHLHEALEKIAVK